MPHTTSTQRPPQRLPVVHSGVRHLPQMQGACAAEIAADKLRACSIRHCWHKCASHASLALPRHSQAELFLVLSGPPTTPWNIACVAPFSQNMREAGGGGGGFQQSSCGALQASLLTIDTLVITTSACTISPLLRWADLDQFGSNGRRQYLALLSVQLCHLLPHFLPHFLRRLRFLLSQS